MDLRARPRHGCPRTLFESVLQSLWRWRAEIAAIYIVVASVVAVLTEIGLV